MDTVCRHFLHFLEMDPDGLHISLGGDLDGCTEMPKGFDGVQDYPKLAQKLLDCGLSETMIKRIFWDNAFEVIKKCCI